MGKIEELLQHIESMVPLYEGMFRDGKRGAIIERKFFIGNFTRSIQGYFDIIRWMTKYFEINSYKDYAYYPDEEIRVIIFIVGHEERVNYFLQLLEKIITLIEYDINPLHKRSLPDRKHTIVDRRRTHRNTILSMIDSLLENKILPRGSLYLQTKRYQESLDTYAKTNIKAIVLKKRFRAQYGKYKIAPINRGIKYP